MDYALSLNTDLHQRKGLITEMLNSKDPATATTTAIEEEDEAAPDVAEWQASPLLPGAVARRSFCAS